MCLFGSENNTYHVKLLITNVINETVLARKRDQFTSKLLQCEKYGYHGFEVLFDEKVILAKDTRYELFAEIRGSDSFFGGDGVSSVKCRHVMFTSFMKEDEETVGYSGSDVVQGQFNGFLFPLRYMLCSSNMCREFEKDLINLTL